MLYYNSCPLTMGVSFQRTLPILLPLSETKGNIYISWCIQTAHSTWHQKSNLSLLRMFFLFRINLVGLAVIKLFRLPPWKTLSWFQIHTHAAQVPLRQIALNHSRHMGQWPHRRGRWKSLSGIQVMARAFVSGVSSEFYCQASNLCNWTPYPHQQHHCWTWAICHGKAKRHIHN